MPSVGMLVEFRTLSSEKSRRRQTRSNKQNHNRYKTFKISRIQRRGFITEHDFWKTDNDDELEDLQNSRRSAYITELYRTTDFDTIEKNSSFFYYTSSYTKIFCP